MKKNLYAAALLLCVSAAADTPITTPAYSTKTDGTAVTGRVAQTDWSFRTDDKIYTNPGTGQRIKQKTFTAKDQKITSTGDLKYYARYNENTSHGNILRLKAERVMTEAEKTALKASIGDVKSIRFKECGRPDGTRYTKVRVNYTR